MNNRLVTSGRVFRICLLHRLAQAVQPADNVRVTYTHEVRYSDMENFRRVVSCLRQTRTIISPDVFFSLFARRSPINGRFLVMTFDDGLLSSYRAAKEVLACYGIKAIFFVPTAILSLKSEKEMKYFAARNLHYGMRDPDSLGPDQYQFMTVDHLLELSASGHMICPHTHSHVFLREVRDRATAQRELIQPKEILERLLHKRIRAFAFPVGTERQAGWYAYQYIRQTYEFCFTALNGINTLKTDPHMFHRDCVPAEASPSYVRMAMEGTYDFYYVLKMIRLKRRVAPRPQDTGGPTGGSVVQCLAPLMNVPRERR